MKQKHLKHLIESILHFLNMQEFKPKQYKIMDSRVCDEYAILEYNDYYNIFIHNNIISLCMTNYNDNNYIHKHYNISDPDSLQKLYEHIIENETNYIE